MFNLITKYIDDEDEVWHHVHYCKNNGFPYIYVNKGDRYSSVHLTVGGKGYQITKDGLELIRKRYEEEHDFTEFILKNESGFIEENTSENPLDCNYGKIMNERIDNFCNRIFDIALEYNEPLQENPEN